MRNALLAGMLIVAPLSAARAEFSIVCDAAEQIDDILSAGQERGFQAAHEKFEAYAKLPDEKLEPTCELAAVPAPEKIGDIVAQYEGVELTPRQLHNVIVFEIHVGARLIYGTLNHFAGPKPEQVSQTAPLTRR